MTLLKLEDLRVTYRGGVAAVQGVDLTVASGQIVGLAGESGSGKSTLAGAILRLLPASAQVAGQVLFEGEDVLKLSWGRLRAVRWTGMSVVFQGAMHALNPVQKVGRQLAEPMRVHGTTGVTVAELLAKVGLPAWRADSYPHELSGGQKQRVMIAMALACSPRLIIADEPTTALDVMVQAQVLQLLKGLAGTTGVSMLLISHDLSVLASTCDTVAVMYAGRIVEHGPARSMFTEAAHPYTAALASAFPVVGEAASRLAPRGLPGDPPDPARLPTGCSFHPRCPVALPECTTIDIALRPLGPDSLREAACVHIGGLA